MKKGSSVPDFRTSVSMKRIEEVKPGSANIILWGRPVKRGYSINRWSSCNDRAAENRR